MEKSIEIIWNKGFSKEENLIAPKIDKLFKQKSKLIFEKFKQKFWIYNYRLIPPALLFSIGHIYLGHILFSIYLMLISLGFFFFNYRIWKSFNNIDINLNSYQYLLALKNNIKKMFSLYTWVYAISTPVLLIPIYWMLPVDSTKFKWLNDLQTPYIILFLVILSLVISIYIVLAYKLEIKIKYSQLIKKLNKTIADMEEFKLELAPATEKEITDHKEIVLGASFGVMLGTGLGIFLGTVFYSANNYDYAMLVSVIIGIVFGGIIGGLIGYTINKQNDLKN